MPATSTLARPPARIGELPPFAPDLLEAEPEICAAIGAAYAPRTDVRPSDFARKFVRLSQKQAALPGPYDPDWKPWILDVLDAEYNEPDKRGIIAIKPSQVGFTVARLIRTACRQLALGGPRLYVTTNDEKAREFSDLYFDPFVSQCPPLAALKDEAVASGDSDRIQHKPFANGFLDVVGAGSESGVISIGRMDVELDEYETSSRLFAERTGKDLWGAARGRLETYAAVGTISAYGHPHFEGEDVDALYRRESDMRRWVFDCPGCSGVVEPCWDRVHFAAVDEITGERDPRSAVFSCPHCARGITDAERAIATRRRGTRAGATGRFESELPPEVARRRLWIGLKINRLADPDVPLFRLADEFVKCKDPKSIAEFKNKRLGECVAKTRAVITIDTVKEAMAAELKGPDAIVLPAGVSFLVAGADVQAPRHYPTLYEVVLAAMPPKLAVVSAQRVSGIATHNAWIQSLAIRTHDGRAMGISAAAIDAAWETGQVLDSCRDPSFLPSLVHGSEGRIVERVPLKFVKHLNEDNPAILAPERKRMKPGRPELGLLRNYYYLHRHSWVDRTIRMIQEGTIEIWSTVPPEFAAHLASNVLRPVAKQHGLDRDREEWECPQEFRDDYLMALVYAVAAAVLVERMDTVSAFPENLGAGEERSDRMERLPERTAADWEGWGGY
jgi:phage terminase large subunit GpA-like protein